MEFLVQYEDGDTRWITHCNDLTRSEPFFDYVQRTPALLPLKHDAKGALKVKQETNKKAITEVRPGQVIFVDLRFYGAEWYRQMKLPDQDLATYMTRCLVSHWCSSAQRKVEIHNELFGDAAVLDHWDVLRHGGNYALPEGAILLTPDDFTTYPQLDHNTWMSDQHADPTIDARPKPPKSKKSGRKKG
jgi:hypothetical protein